MWALIEDGSITKHLSGNRGITIGDIQYSRKIFSLWSKSEREAKGIYEIVWNNAKKKDEAYYINTDVSYAFGNGKVTASYGDATARAHADTTDDDGNVTATGLKTKRIKTLKAQAAGELSKTDWYIVRKADADTAIPSAITNHRAAVRTKCASMETAITNASNTAAIETLYTFVNTADEGDPVVMERPLGELPRLEV